MPPVTAPTQSSTRTQASALVSQLRRDIVAGILQPDAKLKINELAVQYGAGVIPTREALARLSSSGLVVAEDQRGFRVAPVSIEELQDLVALRRTLESRALAESLEHGDVEWESRLVAAEHRLSRIAPRGQEGELGFAEDWDIAHVEFHVALLSACQSPWLMRFVGMLGEQMNRYRHLSTRVDVGGERDVRTEHAEILDAALARDIERATKLLCDHFARTEANARCALALAKGRGAGVRSRDA